MTMTNEEEENYLYTMLIDARKRVEDYASEAHVLQGKRNAAAKSLEEIEQACLDYLTGNGIVESERFKLQTTTIVDVSGEYPDEYARIKVTREPDKRKIAAERPQANWYTIQENKHIHIKGEV